MTLPNNIDELESLKTSLENSKKQLNDEMVELCKPFNEKIKNYSTQITHIIEKITNIKLNSKDSFDDFIQPYLGKYIETDIPAYKLKINSYKKEQKNSFETVNGKFINNYSINNIVNITDNHFNKKNNTLEYNVSNATHRGYSNTMINEDYIKDRFILSKNKNNYNYCKNFITPLSELDVIKMITEQFGNDIDLTTPLFKAKYNNSSDNNCICFSDRVKYTYIIKLQCDSYSRFSISKIEMVEDEYLPGFFTGKNNEHLPKIQKKSVCTLNDILNQCIDIALIMYRYIDKYQDKELKEYFRTKPEMFSSNQLAKDILKIN
jgi:hypothetical protein